MNTTTTTTAINYSMEPMELPKINKKGRPRKSRNIKNQLGGGRKKNKVDANPSVLLYYKDSGTKWNCMSCENTWINSPNVGYVHFPSDSNRIKVWRESLKIIYVHTGKSIVKFDPQFHEVVCEYHFCHNEPISFQIPTFAYQTWKNINPFMDNIEKIIYEEDDLEYFYTS